MNIDFTGEWALVTGAGAGIGQACALVLADAGAHVAVNDIDAASAEKTADQVRQRGRESLVLTGDVGDESVVESLFETLTEATVSLRILINNAGFNLFKGIADTSAAEWDRIMQVDLRGIFLMTRGAIPLLRQAGQSSVVNIASVHAHATVANLTAYAAAKGGIVSMTRSLCQELGPYGVRVNSISPGFTQTPLMDRWLAGEADAAATMDRVNDLHPLGRIAEAKEIGYLATFLSSDYASFITGENVTIDGGLTSRLMH